MDRPNLSPDRGERGVALILALLVLLALSLVGVLLMTSVSVERKITGFSQRTHQALNVAEAGVGEALARLRFGGDVGAAMDPSNPRRVAQIFLASAGSVPVLGADSTGHETRQPIGQWLEYSTTGRGPDVLTVEFKTNAARTVVYRYDASLTPAVQTATGLPIYKVTSTGRKGSSKVKVVTEVIQKPYIANVQAALMADVGIDFKGNAQVCGRNHRADTPAQTQVEGAPRPCETPWELGFGDLPGGWSSNTVTEQGSPTIDGSVPYQQNQTWPFSGPWDPIGMSQAEFWSWIGAPRAAVPNPPTGIIRLDNNSITQDHTGNWHLNGGNGEGMMYVDGDLHINGTFTYRGLLYVEGDLDINGNCWILGAIVVKGVSRLNIANGSCVILYSKDAITQNISKYGGQFVNLSWREVH